MNPIYNKKGAILVMALLLSYTCMVFLLERAALTGCGSAGRGPGVPLAGAGLGGFTITAYCPGTCCNGEWAGLTASGKSIDYYVSRHINIAAVDPSVIPMGSRFTYRGREYRAVDIGGKIRGKRIDLLMPDHRTADDFGVIREQEILLLNGGAGEISRIDDGASDGKDTASGS